MLIALAIIVRFCFPHAQKTVQLKEQFGLLVDHVMELDELSTVQEDCGALRVHQHSVLAVLMWHADNLATHHSVH